MIRRICFALTVVLSSAFATEAQAQVQRAGVRPRGVGNPYYRPPVSPYLNLLRGGGSLTENYYNLVRPQLEFRRGVQTNRQSIGNLQQQTRAIQQEQRDVRTLLGRQAAGSTLRATGHTVSRMTHGKYFGTAR